MRPPDHGATGPRGHGATGPAVSDLRPAQSAAGSIGRRPAAQCGARRPTAGIRRWGGRARAGRRPRRGTTAACPTRQVSDGELEERRQVPPPRVGQPDLAGRRRRARRARPAEAARCAPRRGRRRRARGPSRRRRPAGSGSVPGLHRGAHPDAVALGVVAGEGDGVGRPVGEQHVGRPRGRRRCRAARCRSRARAPACRRAAGAQRRPPGPRALGHRSAQYGMNCSRSNASSSSSSSPSRGWRTRSGAARQVDDLLDDVGPRVGASRSWLSHLQSSSTHHGREMSGGRCDG